MRVIQTPPFRPCVFDRGLAKAALIWINDSLHCLVNQQQREPFAAIFGDGTQGDAGVRAEFTDPGAYDVWAPLWRERLSQEPTLSFGAVADPCRRRRLTPSTVF